MADQQRRLQELREEEARLLREEHSDSIHLQLEAIRADIETATRDLDEHIKQAQDRARRLEQ
jgi:flagellar biosynthesis/type III secretory pathway protein FliH